MEPPHDDREITVNAYLKAAELAKERLHTLQTTEWNMYYAVWLIVLVTLYAIITSLGDAFAAAGAGLIEIVPGLSHGWVRKIRAIAAVMLVYIFLRTLTFYYLREFYSNNYESLTTQRTLYNLYVARALSIASGTALQDLPPPLRIKIGDAYWAPLGPPASKAGDGSAAGGDHASDGTTSLTSEPEPRKHIGAAIAATLFEWPRKGDRTKVQEELLPAELAQATTKYLNSGTYRSRARIMAIVTVFGTSLAGLVAFFAPLEVQKANEVKVQFVPTLATPTPQK
jgi:hypothetical protein